MADREASFLARLHYRMQSLSWSLLVTLLGLSWGLTWLAWLGSDALRNAGYATLADATVAVAISAIFAGWGFLIFWGLTDRGGVHD